MIARILKSRRFSILLGVSSLLLAGLGTAANAQSPSYTVSGWDFDPAFGDYTLGFNFTPTQNVTVTSLGEWVTHAPDGSPGIINASETVGIFDGFGNLLFSTPFTQANATLVGNTLPSGSEFRYVDITSLYSENARTLLANQSYTVAGTIGNNSTGTSAHDLTVDPAIAITSDGLYNSGDTLSGPNPSAPTNDLGYNLYGINFQSGAAAFVAATPEPGSLALFAGLAVSGSVFALRRRRKA